MKKIISGIVAMMIIMLTITSCKKAATVNGGSWSFKSQNYTVTSGIADISQGSPVNTPSGNPYLVSSLATVCQTSNSYGDIVFSFYNTPIVAGSYPITANQYIDSGSTAMGVQMILQTGSGTSLVEKTYYPSPFNSVTAAVTVSSGLVKINLPALQMINANDPTDSAILTATVNQTQPSL